MVYGESKRRKPLSIKDLVDSGHSTPQHSIHTPLAASKTGLVLGLTT